MHVGIDPAGQQLQAARVELEARGAGDARFERCDQAVGGDREVHGLRADVGPRTISS